MALELEFALNALPELCPDALLHSAKLAKFISEKIQLAQGKISFRDFMEYALYAPGLGYYSAGTQKFGMGGDFVTAPELSPLFSRSIGHFCLRALKALCGKEEHPSDYCILELGAGSGKMAAEILTYLTEQNALPNQYCILEVSADLKNRQAELLKQACPHYFHKIKWLEKLPETGELKGIIVANEVLDALPVRRFHINANYEIVEYECRLKDKSEGEDPSSMFQWCLTPIENSEFKFKIEELVSLYSLPPNYSSEINLELKPWLAGLYDCLEKGIVLLIDYGFGASEYYHPTRNMGTLMCHYQHRSHDDVFQYVGLQDITSHVDFSAVGTFGAELGFELLGYTTQAAFLIDNQLLQFAEEYIKEEKMNPLKISQQIQTLIQPHEMGELFKVMIFSKNNAHSNDLTSLCSFVDRRHRL